MDYSQLVDLSPDGIFVSRNNVIVFANPAALRLFGALAPDQVVGQSPLRFFPPDRHTHIRERVRQLLLGKNVPAVEETLLRLDGSVRDVEIIGNLFEDPPDRAIQVIVRDITVELGGIARLLDQLGGALFRMGIDGTLEFVSPAIENLTGIAAARALERPALLLERIGPHDRERLSVLSRRLARGEATAASAEVTVVRTDGSSLVVQVRATATRDAGGMVRAIDGVITEAPAPRLLPRSDAPPVGGTAPGRTSGRFSGRFPCRSTRPAGRSFPRRR